ncbi:MAG: DUF3849 domain-containing protein [Clostridiales bacterium]|nr:DUF3849 domain-containing protein [Clostridiales bacterium]
MASNRDEKMKEITERLEQGVQELFTSERYTEYLRTMSQFHSYSFNNTLLIAMQKPDATLVAGYQAWQKKFNRHVKRGEKGIQIISPAPIREKEIQEKVDEKTGELVLRPDGQPETEEVVHVIPRFRVTTVFDVSQTDGEPLPDLGVEELTADVENYEDFMRAIEQVSPVPIRFGEISSGAKGYYDNGSKEIVLQKDMSESQTMKTAIHETAHAILHDRDVMQTRGIQKDQMTKECEAESVAFTVCQHFGIDTSDYSFPYIASWSSSKEMKELRSSMDTIRHTAADMIDGITEAAQNLQKEQALYTSVELFGTPALFDIGRVADEDVPSGLYRYELRGSDDDPAVPVTIENHVVVNHAATVLTAYPIPIPERNFLRLGEELNFGAEGMITVQDYRQITAGLSSFEMGQRMQNAVIRANEELLFSGNQAQYAIYQIDSEGSGRDYIYMNMDFVQNHDMTVKGSDYKLVYGGTLQPTETLDTLFMKFNMERPDDFTGHSLSVSDVVVMARDGEAKAHYVDSIGFTELPDFIQERRTLWEQQWREVTEFTDSIELDGHEGTWHTSEQIELMGEPIFLMEHNEFGSDVAKVAVNAKGEVVAEDLWNGFDEGFHEAAAEYFAGKGVTYERPEAPVEEPVKEAAAETEENITEETISEVRAVSVESEKTVQEDKVPLYMQSASYAREHGELEQYRQSRNANMACKSAIEQSIFDNFDGMHLKSGAVKPVMEQFGTERTAYILANTIRHKPWDKRFSFKNKQWAQTVPVMADSTDAFGNDVTAEWVVDRHSTVLDGFTSMFRQEILEQSRETEKELTAEEITNFQEIGRHYYPHLRTAEYEFFCDVRGERDLLTYEVSQHDDGEGYSLHTEKFDIWDRMSQKELDKLETIVSREVTFAGWKKEIEQAETAADLREVSYGMMETEYLNLTDEQRERLYQMMDEKEKSLQDGQRDGQNLEQSEETAPPTASQEEKVKVAFYYVDSDPFGDEDESVYHEFPDVESAISAYHEIPNHFEKELGMESTEEQPSRMALVQCKNGIDILYDIEAASLSGKWVTPETMEAQKKVQDSLAVHDVKIAYRFEKEDQYLTIQSVSEGYDYTFYDSSFHEIDGGVYDNPDISVKEAVEEILSDAGISSWPAHRKVMDYEKVSEMVQLAEQEVNREKSESRKTVPEEQQIDAISPISDRTEPTVSLHGRSMADVEETVLSYAQAEIDAMGLHDEVQLHGARVYGSRSREGLYTDGSDLDVVISYSGNIREDDFFNALHESGFSVEGIPVDINPISTEKTGTLEEYLATAEQYLNAKEVQVIADAAPQKPEMEEQSATISFYVAECMEFPVLGEYHEDVGSLQEAMALYEQIPAERMNGIKGIGFTLTDGSMYDGMSYELMSAGIVDRDLVEEIPHFKVSPLVQQALSELEEVYQRSRGAEQAKELEEREPVEIPKESIKLEQDARESAGMSPELQKQTQEDNKSEQRDRSEKATVAAAPGGRKESVLQALRERQAKLKTQETEKPKQNTQSHKKGDQEL